MRSINPARGILLLIVVLAFAFVTCGCSAENSSGSDDDDALDGDDDDDDDDDDLVPDPIQGTVTVHPSPLGNPLARKLTVETEALCKLNGYLTADGEPGHGPSHPEVSKESTIHEFWFYGLLENTVFDYVFLRDGQSKGVVASGKFKTATLPAEKPPIDELKYDPGSLDGDWYLVNLYDKGGGVKLNLIYDRKGRIRSYHPTEGEFTQRLDNGDMVSGNNTQLLGHKLNGETYVLFEVGLNAPVLRHNHHKFHVPSADAGWAMVVFARMGDGLECDLVTPTDQMVGDGFAQIDATGAEVWRWDVFDHQDKIPQTAMDAEVCETYFYGQGTSDWTHGNAVTPVPGENAYLFSMRNVDRVAKIDRDTSEVVWQVGLGLDFTWIGNEPADERWFQAQHDPHWLPPDRFLIYDNHKGIAWSRALELRLDLDAMTAEKVWEYRLGHNASQGNVQRHENGNTLIGGGSRHAIYELPPDGKEGDELFVMKLPYGTVRAEYYPALWNREN
jgi:Arylsulfotransferase (ASST)